MINIEVVSKNESFVNPCDIYGAEHGSVYQMYMNGKPDETYLIGTGCYENPIMIWYDEESNTYRLSSQSEEELEEYYDFVKFLPLNNVKLNIKLEIGDV